jgi:hypothetical protein
MANNKLLFLVAITFFALTLIIPQFANAALNETGNTTTTSQNFSAIQNAGNNLLNQMMCNNDPSYCPGGLNAPRPHFLRSYGLALL